MAKKGSTTATPSQQGADFHSTNADRQFNLESVAGSLLKTVLQEDPNAGAVTTETDDEQPQKADDTQQTDNTPLTKKSDKNEKSLDELNDEEEDTESDSGNEKKDGKDVKKPADKGQAAKKEDVQSTEVQYQEFEDLGKPAVTTDAKIDGADKDDQETKPPTLSQEMQDLLSDPVISQLVEAKKKGINTYDALNQMRYVDYSKMSAEEKIRIACANAGITDEAEIEQEIVAFNSKTPLAKKTELNQITAELEKAQKITNEKIVSTATNQAKQIADISNNFITGVKAMCKDAIGKEFYGKKVDEKTAKAMENLLLNKWDLFKPDGNINIGKALSYAYYDVNLRSVLREQHKTAKSSGAIEALEDVANPDRNNRSVTNRQEDVDDSAESLVKHFVAANS